MKDKSIIVGTVGCYNRVFYSFNLCFKCEMLDYCWKDAMNKYEYDLILAERKSNIKEKYKTYEKKNMKYWNRNINTEKLHY